MPNPKGMLKNTKGDILLYHLHPSLHLPCHGCEGSDHPACHLHPVLLGFRRATQWLLEHPYLFNAKEKDEEKKPYY